MSGAPAFEIAVTLRKVQSDQDGRPVCLLDLSEADERLVYELTDHDGEPVMRLSALYANLIAKLLTRLSKEAVT